MKQIAIGLIWYLLITTTVDSFRQSQLRMEVHQLKERLELLEQVK